VICCEKHFHFVSTGFEIAGDIIETGEGVTMFSKVKDIHSDRQTDRPTERQTLLVLLVGQPEL